MLHVPDMDSMLYMHVYNIRIHARVIIELYSPITALKIVEVCVDVLTVVPTYPAAVGGWRIDGNEHSAIRISVAAPYIMLLHSLLFLELYNNNNNNNNTH